MESLGKSFQNIKTAGLKHISLPPAQKTGFYKTPQEATYTCDECGQPVPPRRYPGGYIRLTCWCVNQKKQEEERKRSRAIADKAKEEVQQRRRAKEYAWGWKNTDFLHRAERKLEEDSKPKDFKPKTPEDMINFSRAKQFAKAPAGVLVLHGPTGNGKTLLADCVFNALRQNYSCMHVTGPDLFDQLSKEFSDPEAYGRFMLRLQHTDVLYLEDPEKARKTDYRQEKYSQIFSPFYDAHKIIIITTNLELNKDLKALEDIVGEHIVSRFCENLLECKFTGADQRRAGRTWTPRAPEKPKAK